MYRELENLSDGKKAGSIRARVKRFMARRAVRPEILSSERTGLEEAAMAIELITSERQLLAFFLGEAAADKLQGDVEKQLDNEIAQTRLNILKIVIANSNYSWAPHELVAKVLSCYCGEPSTIESALSALLEDRILVERSTDHGLISFCEQDLHSSLIGSRELHWDVK